MSNACEMLTLADICDFLKTHDNYVVLTHVNPDGDATGSAFALREALTYIGKRAFCVSPSIYSKVRIPSR